MDQVPKVLKPVVAEWAREGFIVSFKVHSNNAIPSFNTNMSMFLTARNRS